MKNVSMHYLIIIQSSFVEVIHMSKTTIIIRWTVISNEVTSYSLGTTLKLYI